MVREYYVYILASRRNETLYIGITNDLARRVFEHRAGTGARFAKRYGVKLLVYFESYPDVRDAITRKDAQEMAAGLEATANRGQQSSVARFV